MSAPPSAPADRTASKPRAARPRRSRRDYTDVARAQLALCRAQLRVWTRPNGGLVSVSPDASGRAGDGEGEPGTPASALDRERIERVALAVDRACRRGLFRPKCLTRAMATESLLRRAGLSAEPVLRIGVRKRGDQLEAHAWVECGGMVLDDDPRRARGFTDLASAAPLP